MSFTAEDLQWIRQWVGDAPDDTGLQALSDLSRAACALQILRVRRANFVRNPASLAADGVSQGTAANITALNDDISRLERIVAAEDPDAVGGGSTSFLTRPDRERGSCFRTESEVYMAAGQAP